MKPGTRFKKSAGLRIVRDVGFIRSTIDKKSFLSPVTKKSAFPLMAETRTGTSLAAVTPACLLISFSVGRGIIFRCNWDRYFRYKGIPAGSFLLKWRSISRILYFPVRPCRNGSRRVNKSGIIRGAPWSEIKPDRISLESRKTLTAFSAIGLLEQSLPFLPGPGQ